MKTELPELPPLWSDPPPMGHNGGPELRPRRAQREDFVFDPLHYLALLEQRRRQRLQTTSGRPQPAQRGAA